MLKKRNCVAYLSLVSVLFLGLWMFLSCSEKPEVQNPLSSETILTKAGVLQSDIDVEENFAITSEMVEALVAGWKDKKNEEYVIEAFPSEESPLLYVVNFEKGWKMFPADSRFGIVLAENPEEHLDMSRISENAGRDLWFSSIQEQIEFYREKDMEEYNKEFVSFWNSFRSNLPDTSALDKQETASQRGLWVVVEVGRYAADSVIASVPQMVTTEWGQGYPWNTRMPVVGGNVCPAGCAAVAVSQVLRYFNVWGTAPSGLYHSVSVISQTYDSTHNGYQISVSRSDYNYNSPRWLSMPLTSNNGTSAEYQYVSELMLDIGQRLGTYYNVADSGIAYGNYGFYNLYPAHLSFLWSLYTSGMVDTVITNLTNGKPVIMTATRSSDSAHHTWVIDGYQKKVFFTHVDYQIWPANMLPPNSVPVNVLNESELAALYPNYYAGMSFSGRDDEIEADLYFMNWGADGAHRYDLYFADPVNSWEGYNTTKAIHYNLTPWELFIQ